MRILCLVDGFLPQVGGAETAVHNLAEGFITLGHQVMVCTPHYRSKPSHKHNYCLTRYWVPRGFERFGRNDWWIGKQLVRSVNEWNPDVINAVTCWPAGYAAVLNRRRLHVPISITAQGGDIQSIPSIGYGKRLDPKIDEKVRFAVLNSDGLIAISNQIRDEYLGIGATPSRICMIPNSINFDKLARKKESVRASVGLAPDDFVILAVGRNHPKKGFQDLIYAMVSIRQEIPNAVALIVGHNVRELASIVDDHGVADGVRLFDQAKPIGIEFNNTQFSPSEKIETFYQASDIYVMPSIVEGMPLVGIEALASGLPIVASSAVETTGLVEDGINGLLYPLGNVEALAKAIVDLLSTEERRKQMGRVSQGKAKAYDRVSIAKEHVDFFKEIRDRGTNKA